MAGAGEYFSGETAILKATPVSGYRFAGWYQNDVLYSAADKLEYPINHQETFLLARFEARKVEKITLNQLPKTNYTTGESLDVENGKIEICYDDGSQEKLSFTKDMCSGFNLNQAGKQSITVTFDGKSIAYEVTVNSAAVPVTPPPSYPDPVPVPNIDVTKALEEITKASAGSTVTVPVTNNEPLPISILEAVKGKDVTIVFSYGNYSWKINGKSIQDLPAGMTTYDLSIKTIQNSTLSNLANDPNAIQIEISHNGAFPFPVNYLTRWIHY